MMSPGSASDPGALQAVSYALQLCLAGVFLASVIPKARHPRRFVITVETYEVVPRAVARWAAFIVILAEGALVVLLLGGWSPVITVTLASALLVSFAGAVAHNLRRGRAIDCGCFGAASETISSRTLARLAVLAVAVAALAALVASSDARALTPIWWTSHGADVSYSLEVVAVGIGLSLLTIWGLELPDLLRLKRPRSVGRRQGDLVEE